MNEEISQSNTFVQIHHRLLKMGMDYHEAALMFYIAKLNSKGMLCFAAVKTISDDLIIPHRTMRRVVNSAIRKGYIVATKWKRKRILELALDFKLSFQSVQNEHFEGGQNGHYQSSKVSKMDSIGVQSGHLDGVQSGHLPRSNIPRSNYPDFNTEKINKTCEKFGLKKRFQS